MSNPETAVRFRGTAHLRGLAETHRDHVHTAGQLEAAADEIDRLRGLVREIILSPEAAYHGNWFERACEAVPCEGD